MSGMRLRGTICAAVALCAAGGGWLGWSGSAQALRAGPLQEALGESRALIALQLTEQAAAGLAFKGCELAPAPGERSAALGEAFASCWRSKLDPSSPKAPRRLEQAKASARAMAAGMGEEGPAIAREIDKVSQATGSASPLGAAAFYGHMLLRQTQALGAGDQEGVRRLAQLSREEFEARGPGMAAGEARALEADAKLDALSGEAGLAPAARVSKARQEAFERLRTSYWMTQRPQESAQAYAQAPRDGGAALRALQAKALAWARGKPLA